PEPARAVGKADGEGEKPAKRKVPLTITWTKEMRFYGRRNDLQGRQVAIAEFVSTEEDAQGRPLPAGPDIVRAWTEDGLIQCRLMRVYRDKPVSFTRTTAPAKGGREEPAEPEPQADIAAVECFNDITVISRKVDPTFRALLQMHRIQADELLTYDR